MTWVFAGTALAVAGVAVLTPLVLRVVAAARALDREIGVARARIEPAQSRLNAQIAAVPPPEG